MVVVENMESVIQERCCTGQGRGPDRIVYWRICGHTEWKKAYEREKHNMILAEGMNLIEKYGQILNRFSFLKTYETDAVYRVIRESLEKFISECKIPAIWCHGQHTRMLMSDFMFEMKPVKYIIDSRYQQMGSSGFHVIGEEQVAECGIDGIIISSYKYREEIKASLKRDHPFLKYLDFYEELENEGMTLDDGYYTYQHPYIRYKKINSIKRSLGSRCRKEKLYQELVNEYVNIRDFGSATEYAETLFRLYGDKTYLELKNDLEDLYRLEQDTLAGISPDNVLMLCIDGLRRRDVLEGCMPNLKKYLLKNTMFYTNAYSVSTSTYESLVPAYGEYRNLGTRYYESNCVPESDCRFIKEAIGQERNIFFYTDSARYVESEKVRVKEQCQTATEKIWNFITDAAAEKNGLFYLHILYESHYSYPNPDTESELVASGSNIMFDYLEKNGGWIRTDYDLQHADALRYLDRVLAPFLERLPCRMVLYADHGNILIPRETSLEDIGEAEFSYHEELIQVPLAIKSPEVNVNSSDSLMSLFSLNEMICSLLKKQSFTEVENCFVKIQRSAIYNPDFQFLYRKAGKGQELMAFEAFVFRDNYKLVVYEDGLTKLCHGDEIIWDENKKKEYWDRIQDCITVISEPIIA